MSKQKRAQPFAAPKPHTHVSAAAHAAARPKNGAREAFDKRAPSAPAPQRTTRLFPQTVQRNVATPPRPPASQPAPPRGLKPTSPMPPASPPPRNTPQAHGVVRGAPHPTQTALQRACAISADVSRRPAQLLAAAQSKVNAHATHTRAALAAREQPARQAQSAERGLLAQRNQVAQRKQAVGRAQVVQATKIYPNLHPGAVEPIDPGNVFKLSNFADQYRLRKTQSHGVYVPNQLYNFVRTTEGDMLLHNRYRHPSIAEGRQVLYAGEAYFNNGRLEWWSNGSGHYQPDSEDATQAALPMDYFYSYQQVIKGEHKRKKG